MEAVGTLAGGVAHDFNNVLQVALGYSDLILGDEDFPNLYRKDLKKILESAKRGADLVQRLLTFSRKTEIKLQPVNLNRRITDLQKMLERTLPKMILIQLSSQGHCHDQCRSDPDRPSSHEPCSERSGCDAGWREADISKLPTCAWTRSTREGILKPALAIMFC